MIIDTPLGRLDSEHRGRMIEHYFPNASHQVIVLSTDTELDKQNFEKLSPHVSHAYHLVYNELADAPRWMSVTSGEQKKRRHDCVI